MVYKRPPGPVTGQGTSHEHPIIKEEIDVNKNTMSDSRTTPGQCPHEEQSALDYHLDDDNEHHKYG